MSLPVQLPLINLITSGQTTSKTTPKDPAISHILELIEAAVAAEIPLVQLREKHLTAHVLYELTVAAAAITRGSPTRLLVNDRFDIAIAAGANGVQLTSNSLGVDAVRSACGPELVIGVSTHSLAEVLFARDNQADFVLFGPVFETESKRSYGLPQGVGRLGEVARAVENFPVLAIGGITVDNMDSCFAAGVSGVAAISMLSDVKTLQAITELIRERFNSGFAASTPQSSS